MNISLTPELEQMVDDKVKSGRYASASEVIREGLRLLEEQEQIKQQRLSEVRRKIDRGIDNLRSEHCGLRFVIHRSCLVIPYVTTCHARRIRLVDRRWADLHISDWRVAPWLGWGMEEYDRDKSR